RAKMLFNAEHANVQPHSGAQANMAVFFAFAKPGDTVLGMSLSNGGHLTHGSPVNFSGFLYHAVAYGVREDTGRIDMDEVRDLARQHTPKMIIAGFSAYSRPLDFAAFADIAKETGAKLMVDMAHVAGLVAAGITPSPVPHADAVTTTTHKTLRGPRGGLILCKQEYAATINKQVFPGMQGGPLMHVIAAKAVSLLEALQPSFVTYARQVVANARELADALMHRGYAIVSGGTDNHLMLVDLRARGLTGKAAVRHERNSHRNASRDHARLEGNGDAPHRGAHRSRADQCGGRRRHSRRPSRCPRSDIGLPSLHTGRRARRPVVIPESASHLWP